MHTGRKCSFLQGVNCALCGWSRFLQDRAFPAFSA